MLASPAGNSEGLTKKWKIRKGGGAYDYGNPRTWEDNTFWKFLRHGVFKYGSRPWYGMDIFWNRPIKIHVFVDKTNVILLFPSLLSRNSPILIS